ncbi:MAG: hypothetical protein WB624_08750 [Xanthobacteraceae bacterium]
MQQQTDQGRMMPAPYRLYCLKILLAAALLVVVAGVRLPFIGNILAGEESDFAVLLLDNVPISTLSDQHLPRDQVGFIDGKPELTSFHRTVMPYIILERVGRLFASHDAIGHWPPERLTIAARLPFLIIFLLGCSGLIALTVEATAYAGKRSSLGLAIAPLSVALWSLTTPLAVGASIQPQIDGSVGILLLGTAATVLALGDIEQSPGHWRFLTAGVLAGLGKHEWALAFAAAAVGTWLFALVFSSARRRAGVSVGVFLLGLALAVALSYAIAPDEYRQGFYVMEQFYGITGGHLWALEPEQWPFTLPAVVLVVVDGLFVLIVLRPLLRAAPGLLLAYMAAGAITIGYTVSGWPADFFPRYFAPPLIISAIVFIALWLRFKDAIAPAAGWIVVAAALIGLGANYTTLARYYDRKVSLTSLRGTSLADIAQEYAKDARLARATNGIVFAFGGTWLYHPGISYITAGMGKDNAEQHMARLHPALKDKLVFPPE